MLNSYFGGLLILSVFISVMLSAVHPKFKRVTNISTGIVLICAIMLPLVDIISSFDVNEAFDGIVDEFCIDGMTDNAIEKAFEDGIAEYIAKEWKVDRSSVTVRVDGFDMEKMLAERIYVTLSGKAITLDYKELGEVLEERLTSGGECEVSINIGR